MDNSRFDAYCALMEMAGRRQPRERVLHHLEYMFGSIDLAGRRVLDIGGGDGALTFFAALMGAANVTCVEPESSGSTSGVLRRFESVRLQLPDPEVVTLRTDPIQAFDASNGSFDLIISKDSINHFDESACAELHRSEAARQTYRQVFERIYKLAAPGALLVLTDCSRRNLFGDLGLRNPFYRTITWKLHQPPRIWISILRDVGFTEPNVRWKTFYRLGAAGRALLGNPAAAYFLQSHFRLSMKKSR